MISIKQKLFIGFGSLLVVIAGVGALTMARLDDLGQSLSLALHENYRSVAACQEMKDALAAADSCLLLLLNGQEVSGQGLLQAANRRFAQALDVELHNITLPGEGEKAEQLRSLFAHYEQHIGQLITVGQSTEARLQLWQKDIFPLAEQLRQLAQEVLLLNQANMEGADSTARRLAAYIALLCEWLAQQWILRPIQRIELSSH